MTKRFAIGTWVKWNWGNGSPEAKVIDSYFDRLERTINGSWQARNGSRDNPAYVLEQADGQIVLKLHSELEKK
jgi:hypothetical protein